MNEFLIYNIPAIICIAFGGIMCYKEKEGWGWFLFVGLMLSKFPGVIS